MIFRKKKFAAIIFFVFVLAGAFFAWDFFTDNAEFVPYSEFYALAENGKIASVRFSGEKLFFTQKNQALGSEDFSAEKEFYTDNPESPLLKEFLMRHGSSVKVEKDGLEIISFAFDMVFYLIFFVIIFTVFKKFISPNTFKVVRKTGVKFKDVVGMENLKKDMLTVIEIMKNSESYARKGIRMPKGILLEGAPGNGKTLFAKALAGEAHVNFIAAKATDFESMFMAIGPMKVKMLFRKARRIAPCIVFIDEFDGIGTRRNYSGSAIETENTRIVTALLNELDGFESTQGVLVIAATNSIQALDEALIRPGRFDARFKVPYPQEKDRLELCQMYLRGKNPDSTCSVQSLARFFDGFSCAKIESTLNRAAILAIQERKMQFSMDDVKTAAKEN